MDNFFICTVSDYNSSSLSSGGPQFTLHHVEMLCLHVPPSMYLPPSVLHYSCDGDKKLAV